MGFFSNIREAISERVAEIQEKNAFLREVEAEAKPIRREAYKEQIKKGAVAEGRLIAQKLLDKKLTKQTRVTAQNTEEVKKTVEENWGISNPLKYLPDSQLNKKVKKNGN